jgi:hypothetical protein
MNDIVRKAVVSAPLAACVLMLVWYWLGGVDRPGHTADSAPAMSALAGTGVVRAQPGGTAEASGNAGTFSSWMSYQHELDERAGSGGDKALESAAEPAEIAMPEPIYQQDSSVPTEQRISDAAFRAVRGETPQARAAALGELAVIGDISILNTLSQALADPESQVQLAAVTAARRLAQYHGDESGDVQSWLVRVGNGAGNSADPRVAAAARDAADELAQNRGEEQPFP